MSDMKYDAVTKLGGIEIVERVDIPDELIPADAKVEIDAKVYAGYYAGSKEVKTLEQLAYTVGRGSDYVEGKDQGGKIAVKTSPSGGWAAKGRARRGARRARAHGWRAAGSAG